MKSRFQSNKEVINIDLTGRTFGLLKVVGLDGNNKKPGVYWMCECECQKNERVPKQRPIRQDKLLNGKTLSCGCLKTKQRTRGLHKTNSFVFIKNYVIGRTSKGEEFYFDKEDYNLVTSVSTCWHFNDGGYLAARDKRSTAKRYNTTGARKLVYLKDVIMQKQEGEQVKYINYTAKNDNRKSNLMKVCGGKDIGRK